MPFVPVTFVSRSEPHKEVSLEPNGSPDVSQHSSSDHAPPGGENIHISNEGGAGGALTLTEALGGGHHKVMIQSSESANEGSGGGRTEGGNNNTPDLLVTTLSSKIAELHQHIAHVQSMFAVSIDIESFGSAFPAPEYPSPQNPQPQLPAQRPRGFSSSQDAGGQSGGMHPHFLHSPPPASGPSPPTGNSGYYYNRGSFGPSPYQQHNAVHQTTFLPTNASVFSPGGAGGGAFPLSQLRSSVRIHQSVLNALNNNNNGGGPTTVTASPAMNGNHYIFFFATDREQWILL
ncbi:Hypothetical protein, putative [Bodo saltans]|uniref:Uncharacterized protein n=1 Tax=Bodo saltans TaxID=75058 RepID=A0A0S4IWX9_BODSA|nr:Hypothetical protein, putative [Bodo saltans]|eukprot:CUG06500.1 Hypothetical protein, putative [Bodo saltans]